MIPQYSTNASTSVASHFEIIFGRPLMTMESLMEIVYVQCFNYKNWTGVIKVPSVMQYAKKCAKFANETLKGKKAEFYTCSKYPYFIWF